MPKSNYAQKYLEKSTFDVTSKKKSNLSLKKKFSVGFMDLKHSNKENSRSFGYFSGIMNNDTPKQNECESIQLTKKLNKKEKALKILSKSQILTVKEQLVFLSSIEQKINTNEKNKIRQTIFSSFSKKLRKKKNLIKRKMIFSPSKIARNCINFISSQDEKIFINLLSQEENESESKEVIHSIGDLIKLILIFLKIDKDEVIALTVKELIEFLQNQMTKHNINSISNYII